MNPSIHTAQVLPARAVLFLGIVGLHVLLAYLFATGLITQTIHILVPDTLKIIDVEPTKPQPPQLQPEPPLPHPTTLIAIVDPLPPLPINLPPVDPPMSSVSTEVPVGIVGGPGFAEPPAQPPVRMVGRNVMPNTADYYPPSEIRLGHEGTAEIRSCVDPRGKLDGTPTVQATSGRTSLDNAAVRLARDGKYARATRGDEPVPNCYRFLVTFTLH